MTNNDNDLMLFSNNLHMNLIIMKSIMIVHNFHNKLKKHKMYIQVIQHIFIFKKRNFNRDFLIQMRCSMHAICQVKQNLMLFQIKFKINQDNINQKKDYQKWN